MKLSKSKLFQLCLYDVLQVKEDASLPVIREAHAYMKFRMVLKSKHQKSHDCHCFDDEKYLDDYVGDTPPEVNFTDIYDQPNDSSLASYAYMVLTTPSLRRMHDHRTGQFSFYNPSAFVSPKRLINNRHCQWFDDREEGFFTFFRTKFRKISMEEAAFSHEHIKNFPSFGKSGGEVTTVVKPFYQYWLNFTTQKTFEWHDPHPKVLENGSDQASSQFLKNLKSRETLKQRYNRDMRRLVEWLLKNDPRLTPEDVASLLSVQANL
ncbi:DnaJ subfamily C member 21 [Thelohanellus kitauei]|uniref:DnaJ subfamily C member 21 n=1 Tax=Thelohanellus kitauei TaxID=669202 RepID=A0A0C2JYN0_THEKT|nr:DnaJ subfamily C member 21 [Thelohanellus kitauei]